MLLHCFFFIHELNLKLRWHHMPSLWEHTWSLYYRTFFAFLKRKRPISSDTKSTRDFKYNKHNSRSMVGHDFAFFPFRLLCKKHFLVSTLSPKSGTWEIFNFYKIRLGLNKFLWKFLVELHRESGLFLKKKNF